MADIHPPDLCEAPDRETYLDPTRLPYAFCPGCSHARVADQLNAALVDLGRPPTEVVLVSDIGCAGMTDQYFATHAFHGLHGRSVTYATGIKLAQPELTVIVLIGDGGCGIGGHHLISAARRNVGLTVLVLNNFCFGMTGGQYSVTTPTGALTATSPHGVTERAMDIAATVAVNGGAFVARTSAFDPGLPALIGQAISSEGFSLVDIWELCTAHYVPANDFGKAALETMLQNQGQASGVIADAPRPEYAAAYRAAATGLTGRPSLAAKPLPVLFSSPLDRPLGIALAGSAGQRVRSAGTLLGIAAALAGLWATRRDDHPVTVRSGYSLSEILLSPRPIDHPGVEVPDVAVVLSAEGAVRLRGALAQMSPEGRVFMVEGVGSLVTPARVSDIVLPPPARSHVRKGFALLAVAEVLRSLDLLPLAALAEAICRSPAGTVRDGNLAALASLVGSGNLE